MSVKVYTVGGYEFEIYDENNEYFHGDPNSEFVLKQDHDRIVAAKDAENKRLVDERDKWKLECAGQGKLLQSGIVIETDEYGEMIDIIKHLANIGSKKAIAFCVVRKIPFKDFTIARQALGDKKEGE